jgi:hypothetical protein
MPHRTLIALALVAAAASVEAQPAACHVAPWGNDSNDGTEPAPYRTIQRAADSLLPGQTCVIRAGRYRETVTLTRSGAPDQPITFMAAPGEEVTIDGTDPIDAAWTSEDGRHYQTPLDAPTDQVFFRDQAMVIARWPNMKFEENWNEEKKWARTGAGSERGMVMSAALAALGESLTGAQLWIKLGKGNNAFTRAILAHEAGQPALHWDDTDFYDNPRATGEDGRADRIKTFGLHNNRYAVFDHRALLDAEQEWHYDRQANALLFLPPDGHAPEPGEVSVKRRIYGFTGADIAHVEMRGITFFGCTAAFTKARNVVLSECRFLYPYELLTLRDNRQVREDQRPVYIQGENNAVRKCLVTFAPGTSIHVTGRSNRIENCIVTEGSRHGRHGDPNVSLEYDRKGAHDGASAAGESQRWAYTSEEGNVIARSTIFNGSGIGIFLPGPGPGTAEYNHLFNLGLYCSDVSALYIPKGNDRAWTGFHHNWVHDINGIGLRCDQDGSQVLIHHNVVWNCKAGGKANGYDFRIYNNTIFVNNPEHPLLIVKQKQTEVVADWPIQNNAAFRLADRVDLREWGTMSAEEKAKRDYVVDIPDSPVIHHNHMIKPEDQASLFIDPSEDAPDLRPAPGSVLIDRGEPIPGITDTFEGDAPDIGAYEHGGTYWTAGADWWPDGQAPPQTMAEATRRAHAMSQDRRLYREDREAYEEQ